MEEWKRTKKCLEYLLPFLCLILKVKKIESGHLVKKVSQILKFLEEDPSLPELLIDQLNEKFRIPDSDRYLLLTMLNMNKTYEMLEEEVLEILQVKEILEKINLSEAGMKIYLNKTDICNMKDDVTGYIDRQHSRQIVRNLLQTTDKLRDGLMFFSEIAMETKVLIENLGFLLTFFADCSNKSPDCYPTYFLKISDATIFKLPHFVEYLSRSVEEEPEYMNEDIMFLDRIFETLCSCIELTVKAEGDSHRHIMQDLMEFANMKGHSCRQIFLQEVRPLLESSKIKGDSRRHILLALGESSNIKRQVMEINDKGIPSSMFSGIFCECFKFNNRETKRINGQKLSMEDSKLESTSPWCSSQGNSNQKDIVVGLEGMLKITATLIQSGPSGLEILTIVGMAGIGKSTLAGEILDNPIVSSHFDCQAWVTVWEDQKVKDLFYDLLCSVSLTSYEKYERSYEIYERSTTDIAKSLNSCLRGKRYLIVIDNMLSVESLDAVRQFCPDDKNESRILLTTKSMHLATAANPNGTIFCMNLLDESQSWEFLKKQLFGRKSCPSELLDIGKQIAKKCLGLPSALAHVADGLSRILTHDWWLVIENSLNLLECRNPEEYQKILSLDFDQLSSTWRHP